MIIRPSLESMASTAKLGKKLDDTNWTIWREEMILILEMSEVDDLPGPTASG
jgi:hypothetical protein